MTNHEILRELSKVDTNSGGLAPTQVPEEFITNLISEDKTLGEMKTITGIKKEYQLTALNVGGRNIVSATEATAPQSGEIATAVITPRLLTPNDCILPYDVSFKWARQNVAGSKGEEQLNNEFMLAFKNDLVDLAFNGDKATASNNPDYGFLKILNGFIKLLTGDVNVNIYERSSNDTDWKGSVFPGLLKLLPIQYKQDVGKLAIYCNADVLEEYVAQLAGRLSGFGDSFVAGNPKVVFRGIDVKAVPNVPYGTIMVTPKQNLAVGFGEEITLYKEDDTRARNRKYTLEAAVDVNYAVSQAIAWCS